MSENGTETVDELVPGMTGRWLVTTQGGAHVWDLDRMLYTRLPEGQSLAGRFGLDGAPHPITKIGRYPKVGETSIVHFDDPHDPTKYHWRQSSVIKRIERLHAAAENEREAHAPVKPSRRTNPWAFLGAAVKSAIEKEHLASTDTAEDQQEEEAEDQQEEEAEDQQEEESV